MAKVEVADKPALDTESRRAPEKATLTKEMVNAQSVEDAADRLNQRMTESNASTRVSFGAETPQMMKEIEDRIQAREQEQVGKSKEFMKISGLPPELTLKKLLDMQGIAEKSDSLFGKMMTKAKEVKDRVAWLADVVKRGNLQQTVEKGAVAASNYAERKSRIEAMSPNQKKSALIEGIGLALLERTMQKGTEAARKQELQAARDKEIRDLEKQVADMQGAMREAVGMRLGASVDITGKWGTFRRTEESALDHERIKDLLPILQQGQKAKDRLDALRKSPLE